MKTKPHRSSLRSKQAAGLAFSFFLVLAAGSFATLAQEQPKDGRYYESLARKAYQAKDYASFLKNMKTAAEMRPNHPRLMLNLALAYALTGWRSEALQLLDKMADLGLVFPAETIPEFDSLKGAAEFQTMLKKLEHNRLPVIKGTPAFTLHEKGFIPESIAYDPATQTFYLGSVYKRKIVSLNQRGAAKDFATEAVGLWSVMGMKVDAARRLLWVTSAGHPQMSNYKAGENGASGIFKFDLRTGQLLKKYILPNQPRLHWLGDLVLNSRGDVFATDSITPNIYFISHQRDEIELFLADSAFINLQGLDFTADQRRLFVADYAKGIFLVDLKTRKANALTTASNLTPFGIDGLYFYKGTLIGVQNGINPPRLVRLYLSQDLSKVERLETIQANDPVFDEPTLGVLVKDTFYLIANSQWGAIDEKGQLAPADKLKEPTVLKIKL